MKTLIARLITFTTLIIALGLPMKGQAQTFAVSSYFGLNSKPSFFCQTNNNFPSLSQDILYVTTSQFNFSATFIALKFSSIHGANYVSVTAEGQYYLNGSSQATPVVVNALFETIPTDPSTSNDPIDKNPPHDSGKAAQVVTPTYQGRAIIVVTNYKTNAVMYDSGMMDVLSSTGMIIKP